MDDQSHEWMLEKLAAEFMGIASRETIDRVLEESFLQLAGARIQAYVPLFADRFTRERLKAIATNEGAISKEVPEVLFVCVHNAGRSQMAAPLLDKHADGSVHVRSAGSTPAGEIHSNDGMAMEEIGLDLSKEFPKPLTDEVVRAADVVITMGCGDACPVYPGKRYLDWELEDPANKPIEQVRSIRDEIDRGVRALLEELVPAAR
ncbi:MAG: arsenate reductase ArsC [Actinomycetota bacterium]